MSVIGPCITRVFALICISLNSIQFSLFRKFLRMNSEGIRDMVRP